MGKAEEIARLREGARIDYDGQTWEITAHDAYDDASWPSAVWTLSNGTDVRVLEHEYDGEDTFRWFRTAEAQDVTVDGTPVLQAGRDEEAPGTLTYQGTEYALDEEDVRVDTLSTPLPEELTRSTDDRILVGALGGIADYADLPPLFVRVGFVGGALALNLVIPCLLMPMAVALYVLLATAMPEPGDRGPGLDLTHYWVYRNGKEVMALECTESDDWEVYVGREVAPSEFCNLIPEKSVT